MSYFFLTLELERDEELERRDEDRLELERDELLLLEEEE